MTQTYEEAQLYFSYYLQLSRGPTLKWSFFMGVLKLQSNYESCHFWGSQCSHFALKGKTLELKNLYIFKIIF
jgi:hypothetical protein